MKNLKWAVNSLFFALTTVLSFNGCSTGKTTAPPIDLASSSTTSVEIEYGLGHYQHRFTANGDLGHAQVTTYLERAVVEQASVDPSKYASFLAKAIAFTEKPKRAPTEEAECRSPFTVTIKITEKSTEKTYTSRGCRSSDSDGALSRLVRDGEFLIFSKK